jgi:ATPase subunit of ABC transporter with duplicated ATPase domains
VRGVVPWISGSTSQAALFVPESRSSMPNFLALDAVAAVTPDRHPLFDNLSLSIGSERVGLVGRNGSGKSTLLRIIAGLAESAAGHVIRSGTIGMLAQDWPEQWTVAEALGVAGGLAVVERILAGDGVETDFEAVDWTLSARIEAVLLEAGLSAIAPDRLMETLSGGERTRIGIARLLLDRPDLLLLDEPTNNLDADGRAAIGSLVRNWRGGMLVASHDRALLEAMDRIVELTPVGVRIVGGGWSKFAAVRDEARERAAAERERTEAQLRDARREIQASAKPRTGATRPDVPSPRRDQRLAFCSAAAPSAPRTAAVARDAWPTALSPTSPSRPSRRARGSKS